MTAILTKNITDQWIKGSWEEYVNLQHNPDYRKAKFYYHQGQYRIEMSPLGNPHSRDHAIINYAINLFAIFNQIPIDAHDNCTYQKQGKQEAQPDLSYYIGSNVNSIDWDTTIINLDDNPPPNLIIEVASSSLDDDLGNKRLFYEDLGGDEYWVVDVKNVQVIAFKITDNEDQKGSYRISKSEVLPNLEIAILTEALKLSRQTHHTAVSQWLLNQFNP